MNNKLITVATFSSVLKLKLIEESFAHRILILSLTKMTAEGCVPICNLTDGVHLKVSDLDVVVAKKLLQSGDDETMPDQKPDEDVYKKLNLLLNRAKGWILLGFLVIPGGISFPVSFVYATKASNLRRLSEIYAPEITAKINRIRFAAALFTILFWSVGILYVIKQLTH